MVKHTLVVGGTKGIGGTFVDQLALEENSLLSVIARQTIKRHHKNDNVRYWPVDLMKPEDIPGVLEKIVNHAGPISSLVFFQRYRGDDDDWEGEIAVSLTATKTIIDLLAERFSEHGERAIVLVSSIAGFYIADEQPLSYHVGKAGINQMVRYYAVTLGHKGIRINSVSFATIIKERSREFFSQNRSLRERYQRMTPLGRMGTAEEVAEVIKFLCSSKASFITGQNVIVDGGLSVQAHESLMHKVIA
jgi:NAD(P)-dependent dehydrogenase (short-subunit alcohol dehydrogenase family)